MKQAEKSFMFYKIYLKYSKQMHIHAGDKDCGFYSYINAKEVVIPPDVFAKPKEWDIFALLHEIGHILTNTNKMKRCTQEYLATQWAIEEAKRIGFPIPKSYINIYQNYIWKWREVSVNMKSKNIPSKKELSLIV